MPYSQLELLMLELKNGDFTSLEQLQEYFHGQLNEYQVNKTASFKNILKENRGIDLSVVTSQQITGIVEDWRSASNKLNNMVLKDVEKEFDITSHLGYGIISDEAMRDADFEQVHGRIEDNEFVSGLKTEIEEINQKADEIIKMVKSD